MKALSRVLGVLALVACGDGLQPVARAALEMDEVAGGFSYTLDDTFSRVRSPGKDSLPSVVFDGAMSAQRSCVLFGSSFARESFSEVQRDYLAKIRRDLDLEVDEASIERRVFTTPRGIEVTRMFARDRRGKIPPMFCYHFKVADHNWVVYTILAKTDDLSYFDRLLEEIAPTIRLKAAEPGATDNPDDAQRLREDH